MRKSIIFLLITVFAALPLSAKPAGIGISLETGIEDILEVDEEYIIYVQPELTYALGVTGFNFGLGWSVPLVPEADTGEVELWEEYVHTFPGIAFAVGNKNVYAVEDSEFEGSIYITAEHTEGVFTFETEIEALYAPDVEVLLIPGLFHEIEFKKGSVETGVSQNILVFDEIALEETEFSLNLELLIPGGYLAFEIEPVLTEEQDFTMNALIKIEQFY